MNRRTPQYAYALTVIAATLAACGGGGGDSSSTSTTAPTTLSASQRAFEDMILAPASGSYRMYWNLNYSGPQASGTNYAYSDFATMSASPLINGPQTVTQSAPNNITSTLAMPTPGPTRVLRNGAVLVVPGTRGSSRISYVGNDVRVDTLAADNTTVAYSVIRSGYETVALSGAFSSTPAEFAHWHNSFASNPAILNSTATWAAGAAYVKFMQTNLGDRYGVFDCFAATTDANVSPCRTGTTLSAALGAGIASTSDGRTYTLADGTVGTVGGVPVWVASAARPVSTTLTTTVQYRIYFELNGNVYTGALIRDGAAMGGSYWVSNPGGATVLDRLTFLPFHVRMNRAAHDSVVAAMRI